MNTTERVNLREWHIYLDTTVVDGVQHAIRTNAREVSLDGVVVFRQWQQRDGFWQPWPPPKGSES